MTKNLEIALVTNNGSIDREKSIQLFSDTLDAYIAGHETQLETIADAVHAVFDEYRGVNLTMPTIAGMTLRKMNAQPSNYKVLEKLVLDYVRQNADQPAVKSKDGKSVLKAAEPPRTRSFGIQKGKNGGVCRWADVPVKDGESTDSTDSE